SIVLDIFREIASGKGQAELREELRGKGHQFSRSSFSDLLRKRIYIGEVFVRTSDGGHYVKGLHQPIIDKEIFDRVQMVLEEKLQAKGFIKAKSFRPQYPLRGLLLCGSCNGKLTASTSKGRKGKYAY